MKIQILLGYDTTAITLPTSRPRYTRPVFWLLMQPQIWTKKWIHSVFFKHSCLCCVIGVKKYSHTLLYKCLQPISRVAACPAYKVLQCGEFIALVTAFLFTFHTCIWHTENLLYSDLQVICCHYTRQVRKCLWGKTLLVSSLSYISHISSIS